MWDERLINEWSTDLNCGGFYHFMKLLKIEIKKLSKFCFFS